MRYRILVLETDGMKITTFIEFFGYHNLTVVDTVEGAINLLSIEMFDWVFLTGWLDAESEEINKDSGANVAKFMSEELKYTPQVIVHTWNTYIGEAVQFFIPTAKIIPYKTEEFFSIKIEH